VGGGGAGEEGIGRMQGGRDGDRENRGEVGAPIDLREVVIEHHAQIFRIARSLTHSNADAEDLAQSALVRALQQGPLWCGPEQAKWYLIRIVRNLAIDQARARARVVIEPRAVVPDSPAPELLPEELVLRADAATIPLAALADVAPHHREVLSARFLEELSYEKIAERLGTTEHAARQRVYRAMRAVRAVVRPRLT
jgi:RNA polymerase sigma-70 factor (ECF subfamily)